jgi:hypothetical protein
MPLTFPTGVPSPGLYAAENETVSDWLLLAANPILVGQHA